MAFQLKTLDFTKLFSDIQVGDEIVVYDTNGKFNLLVNDRDQSRIILEDVDSKKTTIWEKDNFLENTYEIYDIVREDHFLVSHEKQVFNISLEKFEERELNVETYYIEKQDWEQIFPLDDQKNDLLSYYVEQVSGPSKFLINRAKKKVDDFGELIEYYQLKDAESQKTLAGARLFSNELPQLELFKKNVYKSNIIFPLINDQKYIYNDSNLFKDEDDQRKKFITDSDKDAEGFIDVVVQISQLEEIDVLYAASKDRYNPNTLNLNEARRLEYLGGRLPDIISINKKNWLSRDVLPIYTAYQPLTDNNNYYKFINPKPFFGYRNITPEYEFETAFNKFFYQNRFVRGNLNRLVDLPDKTSISKKINCRTCHGTAKTAESRYSNEKDPYVPLGKDFNLSISREPIEQEPPYVPGEDVNVVGFLLRSPLHVNPDFNFLTKNYISSDSYILQYYGGYLNVIDRDLKRNERSLKRLTTKVTPYDDVNTKHRLDYTMDNFITFPKEEGKQYSQSEYNKILENVIPNQNDIFDIEREEIEKAVNFTDLNKILSKYLMNIKNISVNNYQFISGLFEQKVSDYLSNNDLETDYRKYYSELNRRLDKSLDSLYHTLFILDSNDNLDMNVMADLINGMFKTTDPNVIQHLLKYYFYIDTDFRSIDDSIRLLIKCVYDRYVDYLCNTSALRVVFHPINTIKNPAISKLIDNVKAFYNIDSIRLHRPSKLGVLSELVHMITKKDSGINFSILSQYLYALTAINKLETEEVDAFKKLDNQELRDKSDKYIVEQRETLLRQLKNLEPKISVFADQVTEMKETQYKTVFELPKKTAENVSVESATLKKYVEKFNKIKTLPDEDLRLAEIEKFILNHGLFNRVLRNGMLERVPINEAKYVYWDIPNVKEKMICKHWLLLTKQAWKSNEERKQLQDLLESQWGSRVPNSRYIYCTNCAQIIGLERESDMEGFDDENNAIKLREAVYDPSDLNDNDLLLSGADRDLSKMFVGRDQELYDLLLALISEPLIDMDYNTKLEVVQQTSVKLGEIDSGFFLFESNLVITGINTLPKLAGFVSSGLSKYRTMRAELFPGVAILSEDELARSEADPKKKQFLVVLNKIRSEYDSMISFKTLAIMAGRIVYALVASRPEIKIYGGAERFGQLSIVNNYLINIDKTIDMISKIVEKVVFAGTTGIYKKAKDYNKLSTPDEKTALKSDIQQYYGEFRDIPQLKDRIELKIKAVTEETKAILERVKRTAEWKTFRPYLKIAEDIETELKDIDLAKIEADIANPNSKSRQNYYSYLLSNRLFYSIQKIIQENMGTLKNAYTNFCCLMETRNNYMDFFIKMDQSIGKTLEIMAKLQPNVFYHPSQKLVLLYGKQIELQAPTLLDYINENKIFTKIDEIKRRIKYLLLTYVLLSEEGEHVGEKRLYNRYYDKYLSDINTHSRQDIRDKMKTSNPWMTEADLDYRVDNLYSKTDAGLIIQDMISDKYIWNLEDNVDAILNGKSREESLAIYNDLVKKLYLSSSFYVSKKSVERIPLDKFYDSPRQQLLEQYKTTTSVFNNLILAIKQDFREDKDILEASGDTYSMTLDQYMDRFYKPLVIGIEMYSELPVAIESVPDNELYTWINKFQEKCWKLLDERVVQDNKHLVELSSQNEWIKNLRALNNRKQIFEEIEKGLENQILIEGYTGDSILTQKTIRSKYFKARTQLKNLDTVKRYYEIVNENINRLKYFDMDCVYNILSRDVFKIHDKMAGELEWDLELKRYSIKSYLNNDRYRNINKNYILSSVPYENINSLMAFENRDILSGEFIQLASVSTTYLYYVIIYLIQTELLKLMVDREGDELNFICEYCSKFIWTDNLERIEMLNSMTEKAVKTHLRDLLSKENKDRLDKYTKMSESEKMAHKIYRELGLGNFFVGDVVADETEILSQIESDYQQGDNAAQAKEQASSEESINNQVRLLLGDDATEGSAQMTREYLEQQAAEDKDAAHEFRMVMGSNDVDDDAYNEEILD